MLGWIYTLDIWVVIIFSQIVRSPRTVCAKEGKRMKEDLVDGIHDTECPYEDHLLLSAMQCLIVLYVRLYVS